MKEIKFKVWDKHYERWEERPCAINKNGHLFIYNVDSGDWFEPQHTAYEVVWYTGLKDKNGKDLDWWEGDIVQDTRKYSKDKRFEIVFKQGCFWLKSICGHLCLTCESLTPLLHKFKAIGDIHTTPELLEKPK